MFHAYEVNALPPESLRQTVALIGAVCVVGACLFSLTLLYTITR